MCTRANQLRNIIFFYIFFANLATKSLPEAPGILACVWNTISLQILWWCELIVSNLHCIHSHSRVTVQTLQRALHLFLVMFRVTDSSSPTELIPAGSCYTLYLTQFCIRWMPKHFPVLNKKMPVFPAQKDEYRFVSVGAPKAKGEENTSSIVPSANRKQ